MIFGFFGSKNKKNSIGDFLGEYVAYQQIIGHISKAKSLQKLGRNEEAAQIFSNSEQMALGHCRNNPNDKNSLTLLALLYVEAGASEKAIPVLTRLVSSGQFQITEEERVVLSAELQKLQRQRPLSERTTEGPSGYTQVYCCANCGRLHNFVSMPCPHCDWAPKSLEETARSIVLSSAHFKIPALLVLAREMESGRSAEDIIPNLKDNVRTYLESGKQKQAVEHVFSLLRNNEHKNHDSLSIIRECHSCSTRVMFSGEVECGHCGEKINWPEAIRLLVSMDNLLWLFEQRVEVSPSSEFSEFICLLVAMTNSLLRKQEIPGAKERKYAIDLLAKIAVVADLNKGAIIDVKNPHDLKIYLVKDNMRSDSESFGLFLMKELEFFADKMSSGVRG